MERPHLVGSPGGHLDLLEAIAARSPLRDPVWVTVDGPRARDLAARGGHVIAVPRFGERSVLRVLRNVLRSAAAAARARPRTVICTGAGEVVAFALVSRLLGARLIFVETMARVGDVSRTGRLLGRIAEAVVVQWPESARLHRAAVVCRPLLLADLPADDPAEERRRGTAAFVGTHSAPFARLLRAVEGATRRGVLPAPVRVQAGVSPFASPGVDTEAWVSGDEVRARMLAAEVVVVHGGAGMISTALRSGRRPVVMCRRRRLGEHVDDHQRQIADKLAALGLAVVVEDEISDADVEAAKAPPRLPEPFAALPSVTTVISQLLGAPAEAAAEAA